MTHPPRHRRNNSGNRDELYRPGVGMVIFNRHGKVFVAERIDNPDSWQMPQGGIDEGEAPEVAVFREMEEEIGTRNAEILGIIDEWFYYDFPPATAKRLWDGKYRGQRQKWIALRFLGEDSEINLTSHTDPEFSQWRWISVAGLLDHVVYFKRDLYERVMKEFAQYAAGWKE